VALRFMEDWDGVVALRFMEDWDGVVALYPTEDRDGVVVIILAIKKLGPPPLPLLPGGGESLRVMFIH